MNTVKRADEIVKDFLFIAIFIFIVTFAIKSFAEETVEKVDDYTAKITISSTTEKDGIKTFLSQEKNFTLDEIKKSKSQAEQALKSWQDKMVEAEKNIRIQTDEQIAMWDRLLIEMAKKEIIEKPVITESKEIIIAK